MLVHWIWLSLRKGLNDREKCALLAEFPDPEDLYYSDESRILSLTAGKETAREALLDKNLTEAEEILAQCGKKKTSILCYADRAYPDRLRNIADPPLVLYYQGSLPDLNARPVIGVVGTRKASLYGLNTARRLGRELGEGGGIVISGLAKGIDSIAMEGALAGEGIVLGVLGCGVDVIYPRSSKNLYEATRRQGCLLSEYPPGTPPVGWHFPRRNRIISGLSLGVLVVEAPEKSGALITAREAADQGRDVFVVPGNIDVDSCAGSNSLMRDGAVPVTCGWDILEEYSARYPGTLKKVTLSAERKPAKVAQKEKIPEKEPGKVKKAVDKSPENPYIDTKQPPTGLSEAERAVYDAIGDRPVMVDALIDRLGKPASEVLSELSMLEILGAVSMLPGGRVERR